VDADRRVSPLVAREATLEIQGDLMRCVGAWTVDAAAGLEHWLAGRPRTCLERAIGGPNGKGRTAGRAEISIDGSELVALRRCRRVAATADGRDAREC